jgi:hypothetical protein
MIVASAGATRLAAGAMSRMRPRRQAGAVDQRDMGENRRLGAGAVDGQRGENEQQKGAHDAS